MKRRAVIERLWKEGDDQKTIVEKTGYSYRYVSNILWDLRNPGALKNATDRYVAKHGQSKTSPELNKQWKKANPEKVKRYKLENFSAHQNRTLDRAENHYNRWTTKDIEYLETHGASKTIEELALELKRTYSSIQGMAFKCGISLRGDKMGGGGARFRNAYKTATP